MSQDKPWALMRDTLAEEYSWNQRDLGGAPETTQIDKHYSAGFDDGAMAQLAANDQEIAALKADEGKLNEEIVRLNKNCQEFARQLSAEKELSKTLKRSLDCFLNGNPSGGDVQLARATKYELAEQLAAKDAELERLKNDLSCTETARKEAVKRFHKYRKHRDQLSVRLAAKDAQICVLREALGLTIGQLEYLPNLFPELKDCNEPTITIAREALAKADQLLKSVDVGSKLVARNPSDSECAGPRDSET
jgi:predicted  nucleic acid-binding Zn-ribbon protein